MEAQAVIDPETYNELKELMGAEFVIELSNAYTCETGELIASLSQALAVGDAISFGRLAHSIKSSSASLGALTFSQRARELEMLAKAHDLAGAGPKLERLAAEFAQVKRCLEALRDEP